MPGVDFSFCPGVFSLRYTGIIMHLKAATENSLIWLAIIILLAGLMIDSSTGRFFSAIVSGLIVLIPLLFGTPRWRVFAGVVFAAAVFFTLSLFGEYREDAQSYRARASRPHPYSPPALAQPGGQPSSRESFYLYQAEDHFTCEVPAGWSKEEHHSGLSPDEKKVYGIILNGPGFGAVPIKIDLHYYAAGNLLYRSPEHYIKVFSQPSLGIALEGDQYGPVTEVIVFARVAKTFERLKNLYTADPVLGLPYDKAGKVYEQGEMMAKPFPVREQFVVVPAEEGFYALRYSAPAEHFIKFIDLFVRVKQSFHPLK
jgi:hypothetical protein